MEAKIKKSLRDNRRNKLNKIALERQRLLELHSKKRQLKALTKTLKDK